MDSNKGFLQAGTKPSGVKTAELVWYGSLLLVFFRKLNIQETHLRKTVSARQRELICYITT